MLFTNHLLLLLLMCGQVCLANKRAKIGLVFAKNQHQDLNRYLQYQIKDSSFLASTTHVDIYDSYAVANAICYLMAEGVVAIYGAFPMQSSDVIKSYSDTFHMPLLTSEVAVNITEGEVRPRGKRGRSSVGENSFQLYVRPLYAKAIVDFIRHYSWDSLWYLFDSDEGLQRLQQLLDCLSDNDVDVRVHLFRVNNVQEAVSTLSNLDSKSGIKVFLDLSTEDCQEVLEMQNQDTNGMLQNYFIVGMGISEIKLLPFQFGGMNVSGFRLIDKSNSTIKSFMKKWKTYQKRLNKPFADKIPYETALAIDSIETIEKAVKKMQSIVDKSQKIDCDSNKVEVFGAGKDFMKTLKQTQMQGLTGNVEYDRKGQRQNYKLDVLEVSQSRSLAKIGSWTPIGGLLIQPPDTIRPFKGNNTIANRTRVVTSILSAPYLMRLKNADGSDRKDLKGNAQYEGYCADLAKKIANFVGFQYEIRPVEDGMYGTMKNNTWNGMVGELMKRTAELAIAPLTITAARESAIDFSKPFMSLGISIMIKRMKKDPPSVFSFMNPLSYEIWMCVIFAYIGVSVVLFLVSRFSPFEWHIEDHTDGPSVTNNFTIFNSLWFSLGAFMQQGCDIEPRSVSGRIVGSVWWFFTLIIISSYTANLAAFLTVERMQSPIESAEDLAKQTEIKYGMVESGSTLEFFKKSTIPVYERMWAFMTTTEPSVFTQSTEEGTDRVRQGKFAFLIESTTNDYINQMEPCNTMKVGSNLDSKGYGVGTPTGSDLRDRITLAVLELSEKEELANLEKTWWYDKTQCHHQRENKKELTSSLELANVAGIFYILLGGLSLALIMAAVEFLYNSKVEARRRKTTFTNAVKSKARLSITGMPERQTAPYPYTPSAQLISLDGWSEVNSRTQV